MAGITVTEANMGNLVVGHCRYTTGGRIYARAVDLVYNGNTLPAGTLLKRGVLGDGVSSDLKFAPWLRGDASTPIAVLDVTTTVDNSDLYFADYADCSPIIGGLVRRDRLSIWNGQGATPGVPTVSELEMLRSIRCIGTNVIDLGVIYTPPSGPYDPSELGVNLLGAWYADTGLTMNGDSVSGWAPVYGSLATAGVPFTQATAANQPYLVQRPDGRQSLSFFGPRKMNLNLFGGSNELLENTTVIIAYSQGGVDADGYADPFGLSHTTGYASGMFTTVITPSSLELDTFPTGGNFGSWRVVGAPAVANKSHVVMGCAYSATTLIGHNSNGAFPAKTGTYAACNVGIFTLGNAFPAAGDASCINGEISAIWVFRGAMNAAQLAAACEKMKELYPEIMDPRYAMPSASALSGALLGDRSTYLVSGRVASWHSYMGTQANGAIMTQATAASRPAPANGEIEFDGVDDSLSGTALWAPLSNATAYTLAFAVDVDAAQGSKCSIQQVGGGHYTQLFSNLNSGAMDWDLNTASPPSAGSLGAVSGRHIHVIQRNGTAVSYYVDGVLRGSQTLTDNSATAAATGGYFGVNGGTGGGLNSKCKFKGAWSWTSGTVDVSAIRSAIQGMGWV